jgi:hypothetical protein
VAVVASPGKGYDLEYIWEQVDSGPVKDAASYYIRASETGGEPPGRWWGSGARALGLRPGQIVDRAPCDLLFGERKAPDGTPLARPRPTAARPPGAAEPAVLRPDPVAVQVDLDLPRLAGGERPAGPPGW